MSIEEAQFDDDLMQYLEEKYEHDHPIMSVAAPRDETLRLRRCPYCGGRIIATGLDYKAFQQFVCRKRGCPVYVPWLANHSQFLRVLVVGECAVSQEFLHQGKWYKFQAPEWYENLKSTLLGQGYEPILNHHAPNSYRYFRLRRDKEQRLESGRPHRQEERQATQRDLVEV